MNKKIWKLEGEEEEKKKKKRRKIQIWNDKQ